MDKVAVTQEDENRARAFWNARVAGWKEQSEMQRALVEAFAAHRIATAEACARIAEKHPWHVEIGCIADRDEAIATAIRLQQGSEKP